MSSELTVISWRDIPAQIVARSGKTRVRAELPERFQVAIDRAAMHAGVIGTDDYLAEWNRSSRSCGSDLGAEVAAECERLVQSHPRGVVKRLVENHGRINHEEPTEG